MKKMIFGVAALSLLTLASCKKDYTCTCTSTVTGFPELTTSSSVTINDTKSNAEETCEGGSISTTLGGTTCAID